MGFMGFMGWALLLGSPLHLTPLFPLGSPWFPRKGWSSRATRACGREGEWQGQVPPGSGSVVSPPVPQVVPSPVTSCDSAGQRGHARPHGDARTPRAPWTPRNPGKTRSVCHPWMLLGAPLAVPIPRDPFPSPGISSHSLGCPEQVPQGPPRAPQHKPPRDTVTLSPQGPAGLEGLDGKDGKPGLRVRLWSYLGFEWGAATPGHPQDTLNYFLFLPRVTPVPPGHQG